MNQNENKSPTLKITSKYTVELLKAHHLNRFPFMKPPTGFHGDCVMGRQGECRVFSKLSLLQAYRPHAVK